MNTNVLKFKGPRGNATDAVRCRRESNLLADQLREKLAGRGIRGGVTVISLYALKDTHMGGRRPQCVLVRAHTPFPLVIVPRSIEGVLLGNSWAPEVTVSFTGFRASADLVTLFLEREYEEGIELQYLGEPIGTVMLAAQLLERLKKR